MPSLHGVVRKPEILLVPARKLQRRMPRRCGLRPDSGRVGGALAFGDLLLFHSGGLDAIERSEEHTSELQSRENLVCRLLLEKKKKEKQKTEHEKQEKNENKTHESRLETLQITRRTLVNSLPNARRCNCTMQVNEYM